MESNATNITLVQLASVTFSAADYVVFTLFLCLSTTVGIFFYCRSDKTTRSYFLGNRQLGPIPMGISSGISFNSSAAMMGFPAEMYVHGYFYAVSIFSASIGLTISSCFVANVVQSTGISSLNDYFLARYQSRVLCLIAKLLIIVCILYYMGICMLGSIIAFNLLTGGQISILVALVIGGTVGIFYTSIGGLKAVIWSDVLQTSFMLIGIATVIVKTILDTPGGMAGIIDVNRRYGRIHAPDWSFDPTVRHTMWGLVIASFGILSTYPTQPAYVQRLGALRSKKDCYIASCAAGLVFFLFSLLPSWAGINIFGYYASKGCDIYGRGWVEKNDIIVYYVRDRLSLPGFQGLFLASLFAGSLSSLSSALNASSAILWEDVIRPSLSFQVSEVRAVICSKIIVVIAGVIGMSWCFGLYSFGELILQIANSMDASMYGAYFGMFAVSASIGWINAKGAIAGLVTSFAITCWLGLGSILGGRSKTPVMPTTIENCPRNASETAPSTENEDDGERGFLVDLYSISYLFLTFICLIINFSVAISVSLCTRRKKVGDPKLLFPCCRKLKVCVARSDETDAGRRKDIEDQEEEEDEDEAAIALKPRSA